MHLDSKFINIIDKLISLFTLIILLPFLTIIAIGIKLTSKGPVFFRQLRVGKDLNKFTIYKFRTMSHDRNRFIGESSGINDLDELRKLRNNFVTTSLNDSRVTCLGRFLRKSSLDEVPQIINVLLGEMSIVGPRPDTPVQEVDYSPEQWILRHSIKPGITGLAQINGRSGISSVERIAADLTYVKEKSLKKYLKIIIMTFNQILFKKGAY
jgi:lipopolysaccharide/colanic/teichoic acid biosynthesis glycosyltransferase